MPSDIFFSTFVQDATTNLTYDNGPLDGDRAFDQVKSGKTVQLAAWYTVPRNATTLYWMYEDDSDQKVVLQVR